ncbi:hypothetical protein CJJ23_03425 [Mycoplasmopsis agassizii]|uniref:Uncharacterized protein n=1 Tax=Mycoplasmopsis agassizii TaxID=33922 RepID=A0A269TI94_9BACT|nr:hypothetical protein [Mycoplasmopsis agassizii]PAK21164.1 hypothetical protein CJJ23_03425 [Mycoplasmopsis agassizii]
MKLYFKKKLLLVTTTAVTAISTAAIACTAITPKEKTPDVDKPSKPVEKPKDVGDKPKQVDGKEVDKPSDTKKVDQPKDKPSEVKDTQKSKQGDATTKSEKPKQGDGTTKFEKPRTNPDKPVSRTISIDTKKLEEIAAKLRVGNYQSTYPGQGDNPKLGNAEQSIEGVTRIYSRPNHRFSVADRLTKNFTEDLGQAKITKIKLSLNKNKSSIDVVATLKLNEAIKENVTWTMHNLARVATQAELTQLAEVLGKLEINAQYAIRDIKAKKHLNLGVYSVFKKWVEENNKDNYLIFLHKLFDAEKERKTPKEVQDIANQYLDNYQNKMTFSNWKPDETEENFTVDVTLSNASDPTIKATTTLRFVKFDGKESYKKILDLEKELNAEPSYSPNPAWNEYQTTLSAFYKLYKDNVAKIRNSTPQGTYSKFKPLIELMFEPKLIEKLKDFEVLNTYITPSKDGTELRFALLIVIPEPKKTAFIQVDLKVANLKPNLESNKENLDFLASDINDKTYKWARKEKSLADLKKNFDKIYKKDKNGLVPLDRLFDNLIITGLDSRSFALVSKLSHAVQDLTSKVNETENYLEVTFKIGGKDNSKTEVFSTPVTLKITL